MNRPTDRWIRWITAGDGTLPSGKQIAGRYGRHERWGRLVKHAGNTGKLGHHEIPAEEQARA